MTKSNRRTASMHLTYYYRPTRYYYYYCCAILVLFHANCCKCKSDVAGRQLSEAVSSNQVAAREMRSARLDPTGYFAPNSLHNEYTNKLTFSEYVTYASGSMRQVAGLDNDLHRYDDKQNLVDSFERNQSELIATLSDDINYLANARYDSSEFELMHDQAAATLVENELNQVKCARQLDFMYEQALKLYRDYGSYTQSRRLDLIDLFDSYGPAPGEQLMMGNNNWFGSFQQCQRARVQVSELATSGNSISGRYCVAHLRLPNGLLASSSPAGVNSLNDSQLSSGYTSATGDGASLKLGVCLPSACNSISVLRHSNRIEALIKLVRLKQVPYSSALLTQLYCLPDENSPLRQLSLSARLFVALTSCWLGLIVLVSVKYEYAKARQTIGRAHQQEELALNRPNNKCVSGADHNDGQLSLSKDKLVQIFGLRHAWQQLFATGECADSSPGCTPKSSDGAMMTQNLATLNVDLPKPIVMKLFGDRYEHHQRRQVAESLSCEDTESSRSEPSAPPTPPHQPSSAPPMASRSQPQQLSAIDGIKVISMIWLISAHTLLLFIRSISNGRDFWSLLLDARITTILAGIFPVDSFFTITGILASYLKFNKAPQGQQARQELTQVSYWLEIFVHRYLRFMPMYLLIFWFTRDVSEYIGQGPMWDYATANTSLRSMCKRESVLVPMLFQANFKPIEQHCIKPAWYLASDYQYLLVTPIFIVLLLLSKSLGYLAIGLSVGASLALQFVTVYYPAADSSGAAFSDFEALINFGPMFGAYVLKELWHLYVLPYNRIAPYLIGLLTGHLMYCHNEANNSAAAAARPQGSSSAGSSSHASTESLSLSADGSQDSDNCGGELNGKRPQISTEVCKQNGLKTPETNGATTVTTTTTANRSGSVSEIRMFFAFIRHYINVRIWLPLVVLLSVVYSPLATKLLEPLRGEQAKVSASLLFALLRLAWSLAIARLIYVCFVAKTKPATGEPQQNGSFILDFLSSPKWKPWSKIGLSVLLIQWEVIGYVLQIQNGPPYMSVSFLFTTIIGCIVASYALGLLIYLTFEYPLSQIERLYIKPELFGKTKRQPQNTMKLI